jgi:hypothetical protein
MVRDLAGESMDSSSMSPTHRSELPWAHAGVTEDPTVDFVEFSTLDLGA